ncbi:ADP-ribose pyrophosphatase [Phycisphaerae bacterium RAS2]|nr:ADP-ribose pyrophosphatase [Phycisphaerae bacterium RAS2]
METLLTCPKFFIVRKSVRGRDGRDHLREIVVHPGAVVVLPLLDDGRCLMLRHVRPSVDKVLWELPAGTLDKPGEPPESAAARELEEETGHRAGRIDSLCEFHPSPGILSELIRAYVARDLSPTHQNLDAGEDLDIVPTPVEDAINMALDGRIIDAKTIITLLVWNGRGRP